MGFVRTRSIPSLVAGVRAVVQSRPNSFSAAVIDTRSALVPSTVGPLIRSGYVSSKSHFSAYSDIFYRPAVLMATREHLVRCRSFVCLSRDSDAHPSTSSCVCPLAPLIPPSCSERPSSAHFGRDLCCKRGILRKDRLGLPCLKEPTHSLI